MFDFGLNVEITSSANVEVESVVEEDDSHVKVINVFGNVHVHGWGITVPILEENLIGSSPKKEIFEKKSWALDLNMLDSGLNEEITASALVMDGNVEAVSVVGDGWESSDVDVEMKKMKDEEDGESDGGGRKGKVAGSYEKVKVENDGVRVSGRVLRSGVKMASGSVEVDESVVCFKRQMEAECFDLIELDKEVDEKSQAMGGLNKKQKLCGRPPKRQGEIGFSRPILDENDVGESALVIGNEQEKQKRGRGRPRKRQEGGVSALPIGKEQEKQKRGRGRPRKKQGDIGSSRKILDENDTEEVVESALPVQEKQKRGRGRPRKARGEIGSSRKILDENDVEEVGESSLAVGNEQEKQKRGRGRPRKTQGEIGPGRKILDENDAEEVDEREWLIGKEQKKQKLQGEIGSSGKILDESAWLIGKEQKEEKRRGRPPARQGGNGSSRKILDQKKQKRHRRPLKTRGYSRKTLKLKNSIGRVGSMRMKKQLVRDKIVGMILKAGWTIEYRPRQGRQHLDAVYVDRQGKTHWSAPKAYSSLKMKIERGVACKKEVSAFTSISNKELSILSKTVSKVRSDKNMIKGNKKGKNASSIIITGLAQLKRYKKKLDKEKKEKKATQRSAK